MRSLHRLCERIGYWLSCWLSCPRAWHRSESRIDDDVLYSLQPGDVLLVEGSSRLSTVIKYLTQSSWSHAALFIGPQAAQRFGGRPEELFIEADLAEGVRLVSAAEFIGHPLRICRPVGLSDAELTALLEYAGQRLGQRYDLRNIFDLARYLLPLPPVPSRWRRHMLALGSGDPTRAICSTLIAQAFQHVRYPILPLSAPRSPATPWPRLRRRHYSLFTPRDFDLSPYFAVIKPKLEGDFDPHRLSWEAPPPAPPPDGATNLPAR